MILKDSTKERILLTARDRFIVAGFSKVTVDELAHALGMSKKTIYKYFPTKEILVREVMSRTTSEISSGLEQILNDQNQPFIQKLERVLAFVGQHASKLLKGPLLQDIQRSAPDIWQDFENFRKKQIQTKFANLIGEGIRQGVFRDDVHQELVVHVYLHAVQNIIQPETLAQLPFTAKGVFEGIIKIIFEGILTNEARKGYAFTAHQIDE